MNSTQFNVAMTDWTFPDLQVEEAILNSSGIALRARQCKTEAELAEHCAEADAVLTQFARVDANVIAAMSKARVIVRCGIGVDNVDLDAARERGIPVCNVPDYCLDEVADQTPGLHPRDDAPSCDERQARRLSYRIVSA
jgi:D-3-phosphoglycerate dehydrogenase